jgi:hypothetical protein
MMESKPVPALTMVEPQLFLHLLVPLLTDPTSLDGGHQLDQRGFGPMIGHVILALVGAPLTAQPSLAPRRVAAPAELRSIRHADTHRGELALQGTLGSRTPLVPARQDTRWKASGGRAAMTSAADRLSTDGTGCRDGRPRVRRGGGARDTSAG